MDRASKGGRIKSFVTTILKIAVTVLAFWVLLNHKVADEGHIRLLYPGGETQDVEVGETILLRDGAGVVSSSRELLVDGQSLHLKPGDHLQLRDEREVQVLPEVKITTFKAIKDYLPKIEARSFWYFLLIAAFLKGIGIIASMVRWFLLLIGQGIRFPFGHLAGTFMIGRFLGTFLPSTFGLDGYTLYDAARYSKQTLEVAAAKFIEKLMGVMGIFLTFLVTLPLGYAVFSHNLGANAQRVTILTVAISLGSIIAFFVVLMKPGIIDPLLGLLPKKGKPADLLRKVRSAAGAYESHKGLLLLASFCSFLVHFLTAVMYYFTARAIGATGADIWEVSFASSIQIFATVISPFTIAGEGVREIVTYILLGGMMGGEATILFSALGFWAAEALTLVGGIVWLARRRGYKPRFVLVNGIQVKADEVTKVSTRGGNGGVRRTLQWHRIWNATLGGLYGGALVGLIEAFVIMHLADLEEIWVLPYSMILYGIVGAVFGAGIGLVLQPLAHMIGRHEARGNTFAISMALVFTFWGAIVTRFRLVRDLFRERPPQGMILPLAVLGASAIVGLVLFLLVRRLTAHNRPLARLRNPLVGTVVFIAILGILFITAYITDRGIQSEYETVSAGGEDSSKPNVILIIVDTMRADRLGCYGYKKDTTPNLDKFAEESVFFSQPVAQSSWTRPSIATILTGLYPSTHGAVSKVSMLPGDIITLAEAYSAAGYKTTGYANNINIAPMFGFGQGFHEYHHLSPAYFFLATESAAKLSLYDIFRLIRERFISKAKYVDHYYRDAEYVNKKVFSWLDESATNPFFLFIHYMDPHDPFFHHPYDGVGYARVSMPNPPLEMAQTLSDVYDGEITFWDRHFGMLMDTLRSRGLLENTIVVVTADHGEEFAEHGGWWHGTTLYDEQIIVPLIVRFPDSTYAGRRVDEQVRLLDLPPTLLARCGLPVPPGMQGTSLEWEHPDFDGVMFAYAEEDFEGNLLKAVRSEEWKLIQANKGNPRGLEPLELYNLVDDPREYKNLVERHPDQVKDLQIQIDDYAQQASESAVRGEEVHLDDATKNQLRALGYME